MNNKVNEVENYHEEIEGINDLLNKNAEIYIDNAPCPVIIDSGAGYNFISLPIIKKYNLCPYDINRELKFYTCLEEEFIVKEYVDIEFLYKKRKFKARFLVLPKV